MEEFHLPPPPTKESATITEPISTKLKLARQSFVNNSYSEFNENPTKSLVAVNWQQTDGRTESPHKVVLVS